ncbi:MAG: MBL fold metallo-hydrolase [Myxococcales bacterium]|nr:MBL fold metallo-hydrolase [Myxococcales bacterium]
MPLGLAGIALAPLTTAPLDLAAAGAEALVALAEAIAALGGGGLIVGRHAAPLAALPLVALVGLLTARPRAAAAVAAALAAAALALHPFGPRVDFLAVGQGDAVLIRSQGRAILVDAGPEDSGFRLLGSLRRAGVARLDAAYITHGHPDHFAGLAAVAAALPVAEVLTNGRDHDAPRWRRLRAALARHRVPLRPATPGPRPLGALTLTVLGGGGPPALGENDASITIRVDGPAASALLTGDIEARGEARLVAARPGRVTVLKAPHHGSLTSSGPALLDATCPAAAVVPVGRHNPHGLPHPAVVARYRARGIDLWRTDHDGRVTLRLDDPPSLTAHRRPTRALTDRPCSEPRP